ncbi:uncharacterized protein BcabD6B2_25450 [Babesia caballi]|uniref:Uncharacterized protein n=1 Tax=Babesia caballi TaxID=5871 RepID=A0AAV4LTM5_BABCB|nr:hypothetical protein, conserved [Babesia caballi]
MAIRKGFFRRLRGLCTRQKYEAVVTEPSVNAASTGSTCEPLSEPESTDQAPVLQEVAIEVPPLAIENLVVPPSCASTQREAEEEAVTDVPAPLVTEDVYDPLIMSFSPRVFRRSYESESGDSVTGPAKCDPPQADTAAFGAKDATSGSQSLFWYGVSLIRGENAKKVDSSDHKCPESASSLGEHVSTDISVNGSPSNMQRCQSSLRYYDLMSHQIAGDWSNLNTRVYDALLQYFTGSDVGQNQEICKQWSDNVRILMGKKTAKIVSAFKEAYQGQLEFDSAYMICQSVFTAHKSMRIDVILRARVLAWSVNSRNTLQYTYSYIPRVASGSPRDHEPTYANKFVFECLKRGARRTVSFTRDISSVHGDDLHVATAESVSQVCEGDSIEVPVVLMNALGNTNVDSITFLPIRLEPAEGDTMSSLDKMHREWYTVGPNSQYLRQLFPSDINAYSLVQPGRLQPELSHQVTQVAGIDVITSRSKYTAAKPGGSLVAGVSLRAGMVAEAQNFIGHTMEVVDAQERIVCMLQRAGVHYDRLCHVQLRVVSLRAVSANRVQGDNVRFYTTRG